MLFTFFLSTAYSQDKIATLDVVQLLRDSKAAVSMKNQLNAIAKKYTAEDQKNKKKYRSKKKSFLDKNQH